MDEQLNSIVKQLNRLAQKQTGLNPKAKTIERALKTFVDAYNGGGAGGDSIWGNIIGSIENQTDLIDKIDSMIDDELANFEHVSYKVADSIPTPTEVVIGGETVPTEEGVRYLYKPTGATSYEEYVLIDGVIIDLGSSGDVNLDNYYNKTEVDAALTGKANVSDLPTKTSDLTNDSLFVDKDTDQLTNYTKTTTLNNALNLKADKSTTYTKDEVNTKLDLKADTDDIPTKTSDLTNDSGFITKAVNNLDNYTKTTDLNTALALKADVTDIPTKTSDLTNDSGYVDVNVNNLTNYTKTADMNTALNLKADKSTSYTKTEVNTALGNKQDTLVSGTNIKTINNQSLLGSGNINISSGGSYTAGTGIDITGDEISVDTDTIQTKLVSGTDIKTINGTSLLGSGNLGNFYTKTESDTALGNKVDKTSVKSAKSTTATDIYNSTYINNTLGDLTDLETDAKTDLVSAINEVNNFKYFNSHPRDVTLSGVGFNNDVGEKLLGTAPAIEKKGIYIICGMYTPNYYLQNARELNFIIKKNSNVFRTFTSVISGCYSFTQSFCIMVELDVGDVLSYHIYNSDAKDYSFSGGNVYTYLLRPID